MLTQQILDALKQYTASMQNNVSMVIQTGQHSKRQELVDYLTEISSVSEKLSVEQQDTQGALRSPISFTLEIDGQATGIQFSGIPGGHEFNSLVLAILYS
ncbi:MAG: alkyl hydroperoxide reductase subunit F, partial [Psychromonas sp.]|nr:alkyl hydroperoxide reductase subunit F [Psychromonas sp.]